MAFFPIRTALALDASPVVVVVGHQAAAVEQELSRQFSGAPIRFALQSEQLGTAHAVLCAEEALRGFEGNVLILAADVPVEVRRVVAPDGRFWFTVPSPRYGEMLFHATWLRAVGLRRP